MSKLLKVLLVSSAVFPWTADATSPVDTRVTTPWIRNEQFRCAAVLNGSIFMRTELVFGMSRSAGPDITETEFQSFIDNQITPRFPDGLTVLNGNGQFKDSTGAIIKEKAKLLILLYPFTRASSRKVDDIRGDYLKMFQQQSVLRTDEEQCVSF
jgi:Protein of unknown function (DUF3574)